MTFTSTDEVSDHDDNRRRWRLPDFLTVRHLRAAGGNRALGQPMAHAARQADGPTAGPVAAADRTL